MNKALMGSVISPTAGRLLFANQVIVGLAGYQLINALLSQLELTQARTVPLNSCCDVYTYRIHCRFECC